MLGALNQVTTKSVPVSAGSHTLYFIATDPSGGDNTEAIDDVSISNTPSVTINISSAPGGGVLSAEPDVANPAEQLVQLSDTETGQQRQKLTNSGAESLATFGDSMAQVGSHTVLGAPGSTNLTIQPFGQTLYPANNGFEVPNLGSSNTAHSVQPSGASWSWSGTIGITNAADADQGGSYNMFYADGANHDGSESARGQAAFIQGQSSMSQTVSGFWAGEASVTFWLEPRGPYGSQWGDNPIAVYVDSNYLRTFQPPYADDADTQHFTVFTTVAVNVTAGSHLLTFTGTDPSGGDNTVFVDDVSISNWSLPTLQAGTAMVLDTRSNQPRLLSDPNPLAGDMFGASVAQVGGDVLVGAPGAPIGGEAYLFDSTTGALLATFQESNGQAGDNFGAAAVAIGYQIAIGAPRANGGKGAVFFFDLSGSVPVDPPLGGAAETFNTPQIVSDPAKTAAEGDGFGQAMSASGGRFYVGAPGTAGGGAAYVIDSASLAVISTVPDPAGKSGNEFGASVAGVGSDVVVGAPGTSGGGAAYLIEFSPGTQGLLNATAITLPTPSGQSGFGASVAATGTRLLVGATGDVDIYQGPGIAPLMATENTTLSATLGTFNDSATGKYTATIEWGDGQNSAGTVSTLSAGVYAVSGTHAYSGGGLQNITISITDPTGAAITLNGLAFVSDATLAATAAAVPATEGIAFNGDVATFTDADPSPNKANYSATIDWGDGTTDTIGGTTFTSAQGVFSVPGVHTYADEGTYTLSAEINDADGAAADIVTSVTVADAALTPTVATLPALTNSMTFTGTVATFTDANAGGAVGDFTATIAWGDGATTSGTISPASGGGFGISGSHAYAGDAKYTITTTVHDIGGASATATPTLIVDQPLTAANSSFTLNESSPQTGVNTLTNSVSVAGGDGQPLTFSVINQPNDAAPITISSDGLFTYAPSAYYHGPDQFTVQVSDGLLTATATESVTVSPVNQPPTFSVAASYLAPNNQPATQSVHENAVVPPLTGWATGMQDGTGDSTNNQLNFVVTNDNNSLFAVPPAIDASGNLTFTPKANVFGTANVTVVLTDYPPGQSAGDTAIPGDYVSTPVTFPITVNFVNQAPSLTVTSDAAEANPVVNEFDPRLAGAVATYSEPWASGANGQGDNAPGTGAQTLTYVVTVAATDPNPNDPNLANYNPNLFAVQPAIDAASGNLSFTLANDQHGTANVTVVLENSGGTANGGQNTSTSQSITITVNQVNLPPSFTLTSPSVTVGENSGPQYVAGIAGDIVPGEPGESATNANGTSKLQFQISETNPSLLDPPAIDSQGNLTFTPATNQSGSDTITVQLQDTSQTATGGGTNFGAPQTFTVNVAPGGQTVSELKVKSIEPTSSGFVATFDNQVDAGRLALYGASSDGVPQAVTLVGATGGPVAGSLTIDASKQVVTFAATSGVLPPDTYTVTLSGAFGGFESTSGTPLTGSDGTPGDRYTDTFTIAPPATGAVTLNLPNFARGPGQAVNLPATATSGIPLTVSQAAGITSLEVDINYNPALLDITGASTSVAGAGVTLNTALSGVAELTFTSATALAAETDEDLIDIQANVPAGAASSYGAAQALTLTDISINGGAISGTANSPLEVVAYPGDVDATALTPATGGGYTVSGYTLFDALDELNVVANLDTGFTQYPLVDPTIVGAVTGDPSISLFDALDVLSATAGLNVSDLPPLPSSLNTSPSAAPQVVGPEVARPQSVPAIKPMAESLAPQDAPSNDVAISVGNVSGAPGSTVTVPIMLSDGTDNLSATNPVQAIQVILTYDPSVLTPTSASLGSALMTSDVQAWIPSTNKAYGASTIYLGAIENTGEYPTGGLSGDFSNDVIFNVQFTINAKATGTTSVDVAATTADAAKKPTYVALADKSELTLNPAPTNDSSDPVTGTVTIAEAPAITSGDSTTFTMGTAGSFTVTASGYPAPTFSETGKLPDDVTLSSTGVLAGTPAAGTAGSYPITITAANGVSPDATQSFTLTVDQAPAFTSRDAATFAVGSASSFTVAAGGFPAATYSETGKLPGGVTLDSTTGLLSGTPATGTVGTYDITLTATNSVTAVNQSFTLTVTRGTPAITWSDPADITYGDALGATQLDATVALSGNALPGTFSYTLADGTTPAAGQVLHAGQHQTLDVTFSPTDSADYTTATAQVEINVDPAKLTITADDQTMVYGGTLPKLTVSYNGLVNGDTPDTFASGPNVAPTVTAPATNHVGSYVGAIVASGAVDGDYTITYASGKLTVTPAALTITANDQTMVYGGALPKLTVSYGGLVNGDTAATFASSPNTAPTVTAPATNHVGSYTGAIVASGAVDSDYTITYASGKLTVTPAALTITANDQTMVYGGALPKLTVSYGGLVNGDTAATFASSPNTAPTVTAPATNHVGSYTGAIVPSGAVDGDYTISYVPGKLTVTPAALTIAANDQTMVYGGALPALMVSYSGLVNGDTPATFDSSPNSAPTVTAPATNHVGSYLGAIVASGAVDADYTISYVSGKLTVTRAALTITANDQTMVYGGALPSLTVSYAGLVNGDTAATFGVSPNVAPTVTAPATNHVGSYTGAIVASGAVDGDYTITYASGKLTVTPAALTITANDQTMVYGGTLPSLTVRYGGLVNGDTADTFASSPNTAPTVTAPATNHVGSYVGAIVASGAVDADYTITYVPGMLTVTPASLTITANDQTMVYGGSLPTLTVSYNGLVNGDTPATFGISPNVAPTVSAPGTNQPGSYPGAIVASGAVDADYTISYVAGTLAVEQAPAITSADGATFTVGAEGTFTVVAAGFPAPTLTETAALPGVPPSSNTAGIAAPTGLAAVGVASGGALPTGTYYYVVTALTAGETTPSNEVSVIVTGPTGSVALNWNSASGANGYAVYRGTSPGGENQRVGVSFGTSFTDDGPAGDGLPGGVAFNAATGALGGTPAAGTGGIYPLEIMASNGVLPNATQNFTLTIDEATAITSIAATTFMVGAQSSFAVTASGYPVAALSEAGRLPNGVTFDDATGVLSGTPATGTVGVYPFTLTAGNGIGAATQQLFTLAVDEPINATGDTVSGTAGTAISGTVATFSHGDGSDPAANFSATIDWGDGTTSAGAVSEANGTYSVVGTHTYGSAGNDALAISIQDELGTAATATGAASVAPAPNPGRPISTVEGQVFAGVVAAFDDHYTPSYLPYTGLATIAWGDGHVNTVPVAGTYGNTVYVNGLHGYAEAGTYEVVTVVKGDFGDVTTYASTATVADAPISASGVTLSALTDETFSATVATFTDANPDGTSAEFTATVDWGDGSSATTVAGSDITLANGVFSVAASHAYTQEGDYPLSVVVNDVGGADSTAVGTVMVGAIALAVPSLLATEGIATSGTIATFSDSNPSFTAAGFTAAIDWGDGDSTAGTVSGSSSGGFEVSGSHVYAEEANGLALSVIVGQAFGGAASASGIANVADAPLTGGTASLSAGTEAVGGATLTATFSDANTSAPLTDFSGTIDWGDKTSSAFTSTDVSGSDGNFTITAAHFYAEEGDFPVSVIVHDIGGSTASMAATATVKDAPLTGANTATATGGVEGATPAKLSGATFIDANRGAPLSDFSIAAVNWGDGQSGTAGLSISGSGGNYTVGGSHLYAEDGAYSFSITVKDVGGSTATITGSVDVADAPLTGATAALAASGVEGVKPATLRGATFTDANTGAPLSDFSIAAVNWGDDETSAAGLSISGGNGSYTVSGSHMYAEEGVHNFSIVIKDIGGSTTTITGSANVADAPVNAAGEIVTSTEGATLSGTLATFVDSNPDGTASDYSATIDWGDHSPRTTVSGTEMTETNGTWSIAANHVYKLAGTYPVIVTISDIGGSTAVATATVGVSPAATNATGQTLSGTAYATFSTAVATFTHGDGNVPAADFNASIYWGDGQISSGTVAEDGGKYTVSGTHAYAQPGTFTVAITIAEGGASTMVDGSAVIVPTINVQGAFGLAEDTYVVGSNTITVPATTGVLANDVGPGQLVVKSGTVAGAEGGTFSFHADGSFTYTPPGNFPGFDYAKYTATDAEGDQATATVNVLSQTGGVVWKFYEQVLHRDPDYPGLQGWIQDLMGGGSPGDISAGFFESTELLTQIITGYYEQYLGRAPDPDGLNYYINEWQNDGGPEKVERDFFVSAEFHALAQRQYGNDGAYPVDWLWGLYEIILDRAPDGSGLSYWEQQLPLIGEAQVALEFFTSPEAFDDDVTQWFGEYLGRAPTLAEQSKYANQMLGGASDKVIEQEITNLPEYTTNPPTPPAGSGGRLWDFVPPWSSVSEQQSIGGEAAPEAQIAAADAVFSKLGET